jgi:farnesyl-diphosphate farnesyltransferase
METGMADFAHRASLSSHTKPPTSSSPYLRTISEYDLYCHYVAGLVGEGLSRLFAATGKEQPWIADQLVLSNSMGLLLQKTNILRDFREDCEEGRYFWPVEIWGGYGFGKPEEMYQGHTQDNVNTQDRDKVEGGGKGVDGVEERALWALSEMTLNALSHSIDALDYLVLLRNQTVFNFCAIPAAMAIATLELCFMNPAVFQRNIKIRRAEAVRVRFRSLFFFLFLLFPHLLPLSLLYFILLLTHTPSPTAHHEINQPPGRSAHFPFLLPQDPSKGVTRGPQLPRYLRNVGED